MVCTEQNDTEFYRVIVLGRCGTEVLLVPNGGCYTLPSVQIPCWQRVAENLTAAVKTEWGEEIVCLIELPSTNDGPRYLAAEHLCTQSDSKLPTRWVSVSALSRDSLIDPRDYAAMAKVSGSCNREIEGTCARPFASFGWFVELRTWIDSVIEPMGLHVTRDFRQLNASPAFSLVRFETTGPALWFKAVGEPNQSEFGITCALASLLPDYLPQMLASRPDWNGWLTREVRGSLLSDTQEQALWEKAAATLARLQIQSMDCGSQILAAGARDLGPAALSNLIRPFLDVVAQLMERQTTAPPPILSRKDLLLLAESLQSAVETMEAAGIPEALGHLDLNPGNIIVSPNQSVFLDWAEAYVGNPLLSFEYLSEHFRRFVATDPALQEKLMEFYTDPWRRIVSPAAITEALNASRFLAVFAYAAGTRMHCDQERLRDAKAAGYLRALTRRMHREAIQFNSRRSACLG